MPIAQWLTWRKEVGPKQLEFVNSCLGRIRGVREECKKRGYAVNARESASEVAHGWKPGEVTFHLNEGKLLDEQEELDALLGELDGKLTMINSRTEIGAAPIEEDTPAPPTLQTQ